MKFLQPDDGAPGGGTATLEPTAVAPAPTDSPPVPATTSAPDTSLIAGAGLPVPATPASDKQWINPDGTFTQGWYQRFPEEMQPPLGRIKSVEDLAKSYVNAQQLVGRRGVFIPNEKSSPEEVAEFRKAVGVPETPDGYQIKPAQIPDGLTWNDDLPKPFLSVAHKHHVSQAAMKDFGAAFMQMEQFRVQHSTQQAEEYYTNELREGGTELQKEWKGDYEKNRQRIAQACLYTGTDPQTKGLRDPAMCMMVKRLLDDVSEDKLVGANGGPLPGLSGEAAALDIVNNPTNPMHQRYKDGDPEAVRITRAYFKQGRKK